MEQQKGYIKTIAENGQYGFICPDDPGPDPLRFFSFRTMIPKRKRPFTSADRCRLIGARVGFEEVPAPARSAGEHYRAVNVMVI